MKIGAFVALDPQAGGVYQYGMALAQALQELRSEFRSCLVYDRATGRPDSWAESGWEMMPSSPPTTRATTRRMMVRAIGEAATLRTASLARRVVGRRTRLCDAQEPLAPRSDVETWLRQRDVDVMLYAAPFGHAVESGLPFVMAVHDLQHRIHPEFPEVSADGEWEARERLYTSALPAASAVLVDSETGKEDVLEQYGALIASDRIHVLPFVAPPYLCRPPDDEASSVARRLRLPPRYLLFPAQLWPHKNHVRVVRAIGELHRRGVDVPLVLTGSARGRYQQRVMAEINEIVRGEDLGGLVRNLGYVDDAAMSTMYSRAAGVILPTFFGPTNIPVIEGWAMDVPVLTSDLRGIREHCSDAAILVDPTSIDSIADGIDRLWNDESLRSHLVAAGKRRLLAADPGGFRDGLARVLHLLESSLGAAMISGVRS